MTLALASPEAALAGYWLARADGSVHAFGEVEVLAPGRGQASDAPVVGMAALADGTGYWLVRADGAVRAFGTADYHGSVPPTGATAPAVGMTARPDGHGYWVVTADGGVLAFGDAASLGSVPELGVTARVVGMAAAPDGSAYWLAGDDGGVFTFGRGRFHGSLPGLGVAGRVVGIALADRGTGYWLLGHDGAVFAFGRAQFHGSAAGRGAAVDAASLIIAGAGGYAVVGRDGSVHPLGVAAFHGSPAGLAGAAAAPVVAAAAHVPAERRLSPRATSLLRMLQLRTGGGADADQAGAAGAAISRAFPLQGIVLPAVARPRVSVVIPVHGNAGLTTRCLASLAAAGASVPFEVVVVDDDSPDETAAVLAEVGNLKVVRNEVNLGFTRSCNAGLRASSGEYVVLLNNDTEVTPGWLDELVATADADPTVGVVGAKLVYPDGTLQEAGSIVFRDGSAWNYGKGDDADHPAYGYLREVDYCSGACILVRRRLLDRLGGLDERYAPAYYEDVDLAFAARAHGYRVLYQPRARIVHHEGGSHGTDVSVGVKRHQEVNQVVFAEKWRDALRDRHPRDPARLLLARDARPGPRALVVDHIVPTYDQDAGSLRMFELLSILGDLGFVVTFVPANGSAVQPYTDRLERLGIEVLYQPADVAAHLRELGPGLKLCILSRPKVASQWVEAVRAHAPWATVVYDTVDLHFLRERRHAEINGDLGAWHAAKAVRELELAMVRAADATFTVSEEERAILLEAVPGADVHVVPTIHRHHRASLDVRSRQGLLFVGSFLHPPNRDALHFLVTEIMPLLRRDLPGLRLTVVGSNPSPDVLALAGPDVEVLGWVPDLSPYYAKARVFVAPLRYGAGMKGKIGESLSHGLPTVTTRIGIEGMSLVPDREILVADDPAGFARQVVRICTDDRLWTRVARAGRTLVDERYSPAAARVRVQEILTSLGVGVPSARSISTLGSGAA